MASDFGTGQIDHYKTYKRIQMALSAPLLATQQVEHFRSALCTFYDVHNPAKVGEVDGLLVGGASLAPESFLPIIEYDSM